MKNQPLKKPQSPAEIWGAESEFLRWKLWATISIAPTPSECRWVWGSQVTGYPGLRRPWKFGSFGPQDLRQNHYPTSRNIQNHFFGTFWTALDVNSQVSSSQEGFAICKK